MFSGAAEFTIYISLKTLWCDMAPVAMGWIQSYHLKNWNIYPCRIGLNTTVFLLTNGGLGNACLISFYRRLISGEEDKADLLYESSPVLGFEEALVTVPELWSRVADWTYWFTLNSLGTGFVAIVGISFTELEQECSHGHYCFCLIERNCKHTFSLDQY